MGAAEVFDSKHGRRNLCLCLELIFGLLLLAILILLILSFTVFKPKDPIISVNWVSVEGVSVSINPPVEAQLNLTLLMEISVTNPNKAEFKYGASSSWLYYKGEVVGEAPIPAGDLSAGGTVKMITSLTIMASRLLSIPTLYSDVISGTLTLSTSSSLDGKVYILHLFEHHLVASASCIVVVNLRNTTVTDAACKYTNQL